jgi:hypothetical protein
MRSESGEYKSADQNPFTRQEDQLTSNRSPGHGRVDAGSEHSRRKSWNDRLQISGCESDGNLVPICRGSWISANGGTACAISHTVAPNDQMSTLSGSYAKPLQRESRIRCRTNDRTAMWSDWILTFEPPEPSYGSKEEISVFDGRDGRSWESMGPTCQNRTPAVSEQVTFCGVTRTPLEKSAVGRLVNLKRTAKQSRNRPIFKTPSLFRRRLSDRRSRCEICLVCKYRNANRTCD